MRTLRSGVLYFAVVFAAGFVLGTIRVLWVVPWLGPRIAELIEMPIMLAVLIVAARSIVRRRAVPAAPGHRLAMGGTGLVLLLAAELAVAVPLQGLSARELVTGRDPVSGTAYFLMLMVMAVMPLLVAREGTGRTPRAR